LLFKYIIDTFTLLIILTHKFLLKLNRITDFIITGKPEKHTVLLLNSKKQIFYEKKLPAVIYIANIFDFYSR